MVLFYCQFNDRAHKLSAKPHLKRLVNATEEWREVADQSHDQIARKRNKKIHVLLAFLCHVNELASCDIVDPQILLGSIAGVLCDINLSALETLFDLGTCPTTNTSDLIRWHACAILVNGATWIMP